MATQKAAPPLRDRSQEMEGGARAFAFEPVQESASCGSRPRQTIWLTGR
jgi:hypothetical protein